LPKLARGLTKAEGQPARQALFYLHLAAGMAAELEEDLGEKTSEQVELGCALFAAAQRGDTALVLELLADKADPLQRHAQGQLPLHVARAPDTVRALVAACPGSVAIRSFAGQTPAHLFVESGDEDLLVHIACPLALEPLLQPVAGRSLLGRVEPSLARSVLDKACGPVAFLPSRQDALNSLQSKETFWELARLWRRLPKKLEVLALRYILFEEGPSDVAHHLLQVAVEKLVARTCRDCLEDMAPIGRDDREELAAGLMEVLASWPASGTDRFDFASKVVEMAVELNKREPTAFSALLAMLPSCPVQGAWSPERDALAWLLLGFPTAPLPWQDLEGQEDTNLAGLRTEEELYAAVMDMEAFGLESCRSVAEELVQAVRSVRRSAMKGVEPFQVAIAWMHCARLWQRSSKAEEEAHCSVKRLLGALGQEVDMSKVQYRCRKTESYQEAWQKALAAWPKAPDCLLPGLLVCDLLVTEVALPTALAVREVHDSLLRLKWSVHDAEVLWTANTFDAADGKLEGFAAQEPCLREILLLKTSFGSILVDVRLRIIVKQTLAPALTVLKDAMLGRFEPPDRRPLWEKLLCLVLALRAAEGQLPDQLEVALSDARKALRAEQLRSYAGGFCTECRSSLVV